MLQRRGMVLKRSEEIAQGQMAGVARFGDQAKVGEGEPPDQAALRD